MSERHELRSYSAYNLDIRSSLLLPELLTSAEAGEDISIRVENPGLLPSSDSFRSENGYSITAAKARLNFTEVGTFFIDNGREITVFPLPKIEERLIRLPLLGAALAVLLYQRGKFVLHGSAVEVGGEAVVFVGDKGYGKSTMAAMLCRRGHRLLADDTVAIDIDTTNRHLVLPGFPQVKLYPDAVVAASGRDPDTLEEIASNVSKRSLKPENFCTETLPLGAVYVLGHGTDVRISQIEPQEALRFLIVNSYMARFSSKWLQSGIAASNLQHCADVVNQTPVYLLERPRDLSVLENVALAVEEQQADLF